MRVDVTRLGAAAALAALLALPAMAEERPAFPPARDVAVTYKVNSSQIKTAPEVVLRYSAAADRFRVEGGLPGYVLVDRRAGHASIVLERLGVIMDAPPRAGLDQAFLLENGKHFVRKGGDTVAGQQCTIWEVGGDSASGSACVTADGVVLRASGHDRKGRSGSIEATHVDYAQQAETLFFPPPDLHKVDLAGGLLAGPAVSAMLDRLRRGQP